MLNNLSNKINYFDKKINIKPSTAKLFGEIATNFTKTQLGRNQSSRYYERHRQARSPAADINIGKYGELVASLALYYFFGFPVIPVDIEVRHGHRKEWLCDLPYNKINPEYPDCHVKTCSYSTLNKLKNLGVDDYSWTFQWKNSNGIGGRDDIFKNVNSSDLIILMYVYESWSIDCRLIATGPWNLIHEKLRDPVYSHHIGNKKCIYSNDLRS